LIAHGNNRISVAGLHSFLDTIELKSAGNGLVVVNRLPLERYVLGLNEVPPDWPMNALRAQAVAARTYALNSLLQPRVGDAATYGFDICATIECQVFSGADVIGLPDGHRWVQAVSDTAREAVLYNGQPILARYSSASGGRTFDNEDVFYDEGPYPYLKGKPSPWEKASPLWRWEVTFTRGDLQALLTQAGLWGPAKGRLVSARTLPGPSYKGLPYPDIKFKGTKGSLVKFGDDFRTVARELAPGMFPGRYPSAWHTTSGILPETLPSERFRVVTTGDTVHFYGRGWGHATGMTQWGAYGLALLGRSYVDILEYYYTNTNVAPFDYGGPIDVGVAWAQSSVSATGSFSIVDGNGKVLVRNALGTWGFGYTGGDTVSITPGDIGPPPDSFEPHKRLPTNGAPIHVKILEAPKTVAAGAAAPLTINLSQSARVTTITSGNSKFSDLNEELKGKGRGRISWVAPLEAGSYKVRVEATSARGAGRSTPIDIVVRDKGAAKEPPEDGPKALTDTEQTGASAPLVISAIAVLLIVGCGVAAVTMGKWRKQPSSKSK
jgi:stage II sporulation protein D